MKEVEKLEYRAQQSGEAYLSTDKIDIKVYSLKMRKGVRYFYFTRNITGDYAEITRDQLIELLKNER